MSGLVDGSKLRALRERAGLTLEEASEKLGYSVRALARAEVGEAQPRPQTLRDLLKLYRATLDEVRRSSEPAGPVTMKSAAPIFEQPLSRLEAMVKASLDDPAEARSARKVGSRKAEWLSPARFQAVFTAFELAKGKLFWVEATLDRHRGLTHDEAKVLGTRAGIGARVLLTREAGGLPMSITVHTREAADTSIALDALGQRVLAVVEVVVFESRVLHFFGTEVPKEWGLAVRSFELLPA